MFHGTIPVTGARASGVAPPNHGPTPETGARAYSAAPLSLGTIPATGARASSVFPLGRGATLATGAYASGAAPLNHDCIPATGACSSRAAPLSCGTGTCASSAALLGHVPCSTRTVALARHSFQQRCHPLFPPGHTMAVGLRCGKADAKTSRSRLELDSAIPRCSDGRSTPFPVREELTTLIHPPSLAGLQGRITLLLFSQVPFMKSDPAHHISAGIAQEGMRGAFRSRVSFMAPWRNLQLMSHRLLS